MISYSPRMIVIPFGDCFITNNLPLRSQPVLPAEKAGPHPPTNPFGLCPQANHIGDVSSHKLYFHSYKNMFVSHSYQLFNTIRISHQQKPFLHHQPKPQPQGHSTVMDFLDKDNYKARPPKLSPLLQNSITSAINSDDPAEVLCWLITTSTTPLQTPFPAPNGYVLRSRA